MKSSITKRLFIYIICVVLGICTLILLSNTLLLRPLYYSTLRHTMLHAMETLSEIDFSQDAEDWIDELGTKTAGSAYDIIVRTQDELLFSSSREIGLMARPGYPGDDAKTDPDSEPAHEPRLSDNAFIMRNRAVDLEQVLEDTYLGMTIEPRTEIEMLVCEKELDSGITLLLTQAIEPINQSVRQANILLAACAVVALGLSFLFVFKLSKRFTRPVREINNTVGALAALDFSRKCDIKTGDELQNLGEDVNRLGEALKNALSTLREQNEQLEKDILSQRMFISNASHELRTPLALIKGYADEMCAGYAKDAMKKDAYIEIIAEEAAKMNRLLKDMLELSRLESGRIEMLNETLRLGESIQAFLDKYEGFIIQNGLDISLDIEEGATGVFDGMRFEQILANYISNAARYGDAQKTIRISVKTTDDQVRISVFNTGPAIPTDVMDNLWDRFNKADSARTRAEDSYGLGLSIVKAIQTASGQKFGVKNVEGGVEFWFEVQRFRE